MVPTSTTCAPRRQWPLWVGTLVTGADTFTFLFLQYFGMRKLEALFVALVFTMCVTFWINFGASGPVWTGLPSANSSGSILFSTVVPTCEDYALLQGARPPPLPPARRARIGNAVTKQDTTAGQCPATRARTRDLAVAGPGVHPLSLLVLYPLR